MRSLQKFVKLLVEGVKKEIQDAQRTKALADKLDIWPTPGKLMVAQPSLEAAEPPHEAKGDVDFTGSASAACFTTTPPLPC